MSDWQATELVWSGIRQNVGDVITLQINLMASLHHVCSTDESPNRHMCPSDDNSWCGYNRNKDTFKHVHGLPDAITEAIEPIYDELATPISCANVYMEWHRTITNA